MKRNILYLPIKWTILVDTMFARVPLFRKHYMTSNSNTYYMYSRVRVGNMLQSIERVKFSISLTKISVKKLAREKPVC